jgi:hypothetical protein
MDYGNIISGAFEYTKDGLIGKWGRWILLIILYLVQLFTLFLVPLFSGYLVRVLAGNTPAPEIDQWGKLFVDGWKYNIIGLIYMIPVIIILLVFGGISILSAIAVQGATDPSAIAPAIFSAITGLLLAIIVALIIGIVLSFALLRFAHTDSFGQAFNFGAIFAHIGEIGWGAWILALIIIAIIAVVYGFVVGIINMIPILGFIITLFLGVGFAIFNARYLAEIYESVSAPQ